MSLDRYLAVAHPIRSLSLRTVQNANRAIMVLWAIIIMVCVPTVITHNVSYGDNYGVSVCAFQREVYSPTIYQVTFFLLSYIIPIFIIIILYILMLKRLWFGVIPGRNMSSESVRSKKKVTRMVVIVVIIFAVCWCPIQIVLVLKSFNLYSFTPTKIIIQIAGHILGKCLRPLALGKGLDRADSCSSLPVLHCLAPSGFSIKCSLPADCNREPVSVMHVSPH